MTHIQPYAAIRKKWWLLSHGRFLFGAGIFVLFFVSPIVFLIVASGADWSSLASFVCFMILLSCGVLLAAFGNVYSKLQAIVEGLSEAQMVDFDARRLMMKIRDQGREYTIMYHTSTSPYEQWEVLKRSFKGWTTPPEHYQIWTPFEGGASNVDRYDFLKFIRPSKFLRFFSGFVEPRQREVVFDDYLKSTVLHLNEKAKEISSLRFVGLAYEGGQTILLALLTRRADAVHIKRILDLFEEIIRGVKYSEVSEEWD